MVTHEERIRLLIKKFSSEVDSLSDEERAHLETLNHVLDAENPRYSAEDWKLLDEAEALVNEFGNE